MTIDQSAAGEQFSTTNTSPGDDAIPAGSGSFTVPASIVDDEAGEQFNTLNGSGATGVAVSGGESISGTVSVEYGGTEFGSTTVTTDAYAVGGVPSPGEAGESITETGYEAVAETESGGVSVQTFSGAVASLVDFDFGSLEVTLKDANGDVVSGEQVDVDGAGISTDTNGVATLDTSGDTTASAFEQSVSKTVTVNGGSTATTTLTAAGLKGTVSSPGGGSVGGLLVVVKDTSGNTIARKRTDPTGAYEFPALPANTDVTIEAGAFSRDTTTPGSGKFGTRNIPFNTDTKGVEVVVVDDETGDPVADCPVEVGGTTARTNLNGVGAAVAPASELGDTVTATIAAGDRRYGTVQTEIEPALNGTETVELTLTRSENIGQAN